VSRIARYALILVVLLGLSCNLITQPISDVQNLAGTAQSLGSQAPDFATMMANSTGMPSIPGMPDTSACLNVTGTPSATWNDVPIMTDATAGKEAGSGLYCYTTPSAAADVKTFYDDKLAALGWTSSFAAPAMGDFGVLTYSKDPHTLLISIVRNDNVSLVSLVLQ
jgi:hypothetical protein